MLVLARKTISCLLTLCPPKPVNAEGIASTTPCMRPCVHQATCCSQSPGARPTPLLTLEHPSPLSHALPYIPHAYTLPSGNYARTPPPLGCLLASGRPASVGAPQGTPPLAGAPEPSRGGPKLAPRPHRGSPAAPPRRCPTSPSLTSLPRSCCLPWPPAPVTRFPKLLDPPAPLKSG